jgi:hypothetical protein
MITKEERERFRILWHSVSSQIRCYDDKTECLTDSGWKLFKEISSYDKVMTMNQNTKEMEYQTPTEL